jgi:hypothetical protein
VTVLSEAERSLAALLAAAEQRGREAALREVAAWHESQSALWTSPSLVRR